MFLIPFKKKVIEATYIKNMSTITALKCAECCVHSRKLLHFNTINNVSTLLHSTNTKILKKKDHGPRKGTPTIQATQDTFTNIQQLRQRAKELCQPH